MYFVSGEGNTLRGRSAPQVIFNSATLAREVIFWIITNMHF